MLGAGCGSPGLPPMRCAILPQLNAVSLDSLSLLINNRHSHVTQFRICDVLSLSVTGENVLVARQPRGGVRDQDRDRDRGVGKSEGVKQNGIR